MGLAGQIKSFRGPQFVVHAWFILMYRYLSKFQNGFVLVQNAGHAFAVAVGHVLAGMGTNQTYTHLQNPPQKVPDFILIWKKGIRLGLV